MQLLSTLILFFGLASPQLHALHFPTDMNEVEISLHTVGRGPKIFMIGGHSLLRVKAGKFDVFMNWGIFDFRTPYFPLRFVKGDLDYILEAQDQRFAFKVYSLEKRSVTEDVLNLSVAQKQDLIARLKTQLLPGNESFRYHYFLANCSTKVRDILDEVFKGALKRNTEPKMTSLTLRHEMRRIFDYYLVPFLLLDIMMNAGVDAPMNRWESMFLPHYLRSELLRMSRVGDDGVEVVGSKLIDTSRVIQEFPEPTSHTLAVDGLLLLTSTLLLLALIAWSFRRPTKWSTRLSGLYLAILGGLMGGIGTAMLLVWFLTEQIHGKFSASLLVINPLDLFYVWSALLIWRGKPLRTMAVIFSVWKGSSVSLALLLWMLGWLQQDISTSLGFALVGVLACLLLLRSESV